MHTHMERLGNVHQLLLRSIVALGILVLAPAFQQPKNEKKEWN